MHEEANSAETAENAARTAILPQEDNTLLESIMVDLADSLRRA